jgi:iodotyrosine deiodinase
MEKIKEINGFKHLPFSITEYSPKELKEKVNDFFQLMNARRTVRDISSRPVNREVISQLMMTASTAPSGAHKQPWVFCAIADPKVKKSIRKAAEAEEKESYEGRMSQRWLEDLKPIATTWEKPFLENAPWLIVVLKKIYELNDDDKQNNYYVNESVGIACGMLITAIHNAGLVTLTHTPSPMNFLTKILDRPKNERPFLLLPIGYASKDAYVPDLKRKELADISIFY